LNNRGYAVIISRPWVPLGAERLAGKFEFGTLT